MEPWTNQHQLETYGISSPYLENNDRIILEFHVRAATIKNENFWNGNFQKFYIFDSILRQVPI